MLGWAYAPFNSRHLMNPEAKRGLRVDFRSRRLLVDDAGRHSTAVGLATVGLEWVAQLSVDSRPATVCAYVSGPAEPPTMLLLAALHNAGHHVRVPVCEPEFALSWASWSPGVTLAESPYAPVWEPTGPRRPFADLGPVLGILLPALAADTSGVRLGQGGGYYDRFLASIPTSGTSVPTAAVVNEWELLEPGVLPHDALDLPVDYVITPSTFVACGN